MSKTETIAICITIILIIAIITYAVYDYSNKKPLPQRCADDCYGTSNLIPEYNHCINTCYQLNETKEKLK